MIAHCLWDVISNLKCIFYLQDDLYQYRWVDVRGAFDGLRGNADIRKVLRL